MIHSRMELGMKHYEHAYPGTDIVLFEPDHHDPALYLANTFSYAQRRQLAEHAYQQTRQLLRKDAEHLVPKFARHGVTLNYAALLDVQRHLIDDATVGATRDSERNDLQPARAVDTLHDTLKHLSTWVDTPAQRGLGT
jgi:hypothetical protein